VFDCAAFIAILVKDGSGGFMKAVDGGKAYNITMRCTRELKDRLEAYHERFYGQISFNMFLGQLLEWQISILEGGSVKSGS